MLNIKALLPSLRSPFGCLILALTVFGCGDGDSGPDDTAGNNDANNVANNTSSDTRQALLANIGQNVILSTYADFITQMEALESATGAFSQDPSAQNLSAAQDAWRAAITVWQHAEVFQLGPAGLMDSVAGGEDIRDDIYSWPFVNRCRVDQEIVEGAYEDPSAFAAEPINVRGLDAMEYLLFNDTDQNDCTPNSGINRDGDWNALGDVDAIRARRAQYAHTLAGLSLQRARDLHDAWANDGGNFLSQLSTAGNGSSTYRSAQEALNALSDAMFYVEKETKDMKLAEPAGLANCDTDFCPEARESLFADHSKEHILANVIAFRQIYHGGDVEGDGIGFDDLLIEAGAEDLNTEMTTKLAQAQEAIEAIEGTMAQALADNPEQVVEAYNLLQDAMTLFKTQFLSILDLELPQRAEGDND